MVVHIMCWKEGERLCVSVCRHAWRECDVTVVSCWTLFIWSHGATSAMVRTFTHFFFLTISLLYFVLGDSGPDGSCTYCSLIILTILCYMCLANSAYSLYISLLVDLWWLYMLRRHSFSSWWHDKKNPDQVCDFQCQSEMKIINKNARKVFDDNLSMVKLL